MSVEVVPPKRIPILLMILVFIMLVLSVAAVYQAIEAYRNGSLDLASIILSISAIVLSSYMIIQMRSKPIKLGFEMYDVSTTIQCDRCNYETTRKFERGDYIFKEVGSCPKCKGNLFISSIYREVKEKKRKSFFASSI